MIFDSQTCTDAWSTKSLPEFQHRFNAISNNTQPILCVQTKSTNTKPCCTQVQSHPDHYVRWQTPRALPTTYYGEQHDIWTILPHIHIQANRATIRRNRVPRAELFQITSSFSANSHLGEPPLGTRPIGSLPVPSRTGHRSCMFTPSS